MRGELSHIQYEHVCFYHFLNIVDARKRLISVLICLKRKRCARTAATSDENRGHGHLLLFLEMNGLGIYNQLL
jgi:hypothetical protein